MLTVLDLFSGIGGFSLGLESTGGFRTTAFCEIDPYCRAVLKKHWPEVPIHEDITKLKGTKGQADVICGGFPCQDISVAGRGAGIKGARSGLWSHYARCIDEIRPKYAIVENVSALLVRGLDTILGDLAALRYDAEWHCIPASAVGAPHRRDRIWIVAYPNANERPHTRRSSFISRHLLDKTQRKETSNRPASYSNGEATVSDTSQLHRNGSGVYSRSNQKSMENFPEFGNSNATANLAHPNRTYVKRNERPIRGDKTPTIAVRDGWWVLEPCVGRVVDGIPLAMDKHRLQSLGNAVVPETPKRIGQAILEAEGLM